MIASALEWKKTTTEVLRNTPPSPLPPSGVPVKHYEAEAAAQLHMRFSISCGFFIDWTCFLFVLWVMALLRGWKFDGIEDKSSSIRGFPTRSCTPMRWLPIKPTCMHGLSRCADNVVLLADQMQLAQPIQGSCPGDRGLSILDYCLEDHTTMPLELGGFLGISWCLCCDLHNPFGLRAPGKHLKHR